MKLTIKRQVLVYTGLSMCYPLYTAYNAVITVPVADLIGKPIRTMHIPITYKNIPICGGTQNNLLACPRVHQALFNEIVTIVDETETEYCVEITNTYYLAGKNNSLSTRYWTLKKNCTVLDQETCASLPIPTPISFKKPSSITNQKVLTLVHPFHDHAINTPFSVGTRFVYLPEKSDAQSYAVTYYNPCKKQSAISLIPQYKCFFADKNVTPHEKRNAMINLIRTWIGLQDKHHIPYVWGGCSYTHKYTGPYTETHKKVGDIKYSYYTYPHNKKGMSHTGFDCSGLILRAAQCVGIPFFCKNSHTMQVQLKPVEDYSAIQPGDIVWIPGHVMIIADLARNTLIEARGYSHGYGMIQETPIREQFKNINTIEDLMHQYKNKKPLYRLDKEGTIVKTVPSYKILTLF